MWAVDGLGDSGFGAGLEGLQGCWAIESVAGADRSAGSGLPVLARFHTVAVMARAEILARAAVQMVSLG